jgi:hypothetical protein
MWNDPIVEEVRSVRKQLAAKFGFDVHSIFADLRKRQAMLGSRLVRRSRASDTEQAVPPDRDFAPPHPGR